jgi:hypothetical protein
VKNAGGNTAKAQEYFRRILKGNAWVHERRNTESQRRALDATRTRCRRVVG